MHLASRKIQQRSHLCWFTISVSTRTGGAGKLFNWSLKVKFFTAVRCCKCKDSHTVLSTVSSYAHPVFMYTEKSYSFVFVHFKLSPAVYWIMVNIFILQLFFFPMGFYQDLLQEVLPESSYIIIAYMRG